MKKIVKAMSTLVVSTVVLVGCGNSENTWSEDYGLADVEFPLEEQVSLKFLTSSSPLAPADPNEKLIYERLEEKTNVHIEWRNFVGEAFGERRNLAMSSGEMPDAIINSEYSDYELLNLAEDEAIIPLNDLIDNYMPNLQKVLEEAPQYRAMMTAPDGNIYAFPWIEELGEGRESIHSVDNFPWINVEWLEELGLEMPTTTDELKEVLIAFKESDPAGNGQTIPMSFIINDGGQDLGFLFGSFGLGDTWDRTVVTNDGEVKLTAADEGYKEAITFMNELYEEGLLDVEGFEQDWPTYVAKGQEGRYGLYFTWDKANISGMNDTYDLMPPLYGPDGHKNVARNNGMGFDRSRMVITSANQNLELTAKWIDQLYDPYQSVQNNWGTYGDETQQNIFEFDESAQMLKHLDLEGTAPVELRERTNIGGPLAILDSYYGDITTMPDDAAWRLDLMREVMVPHMSADHIYPRVFFDLDELRRLSQIEADFYPYINRKRAEWITNGKIEEEWDDYLEELERLSYSEWLEIKQAGFDRSVE
ncbi:ABC transporter substrate-binding protein [Alkalihalobacillus alcalophilus ATCC 27647 = CGMCC 1.3604]|uniref:ABC transporter substrate-binding protein n=1 Tax=Alkalihalobacillus alcalophilus ATCC 27647 = CGMCC 1.3604 TaxID=1218173 RepID=A0A094WE19_ALKAL|nr:extracellular solute-binding protein [Alkalihalobacillus alcalophilus]KGA95999.1 ABC transporter substrate-binding protein [Alkalihalobacillus alcalophilus ATCC 27647 = CGMCC 1.3604]MED1562472.1 extracellular solute-binding protein [Alkalihalobacillus alcalophilus]THG88571.1 ABC transporter substrate-binding protein [Alkalihalobacillus alcalophilus ATCC 27647 = CGMCC 1.3604]